MSENGGGPDLLPAGWVRASLGDLVSVRYGKALNASMRRSGPVRVVTSAGVTGEHDEALHDGPAVVVGRKGAVGRVTVVDGPAWTTDTAYYLLLPPELDARFLAEQLRLAQLHRLDQSTAVPSLLRDKLEKVMVVIAPIAEQRRVLALVDEESKHLDEASRQLTITCGDLDLLRASVLAELGKTEAPLVAVGELGEVFVGATPKRAVPEFWNGDIPWVSSGEVAFCHISRTRETITDAGLGNRRTRLHPPGTVLLAMIGEGKTRGQAAVLDVAAAHNQNAASIRLDHEKMLPDFLYLCFMRQYATNRALGRGGQQPALNKELVKAIEVPCPSLEVQVELVEHIQSTLRTADDNEADVKLLERLAADARAALLRDALSGRLTAQDPTDEPAAVALERVRARQDAAAPRRRRGHAPSSSTDAQARTI